MLAIKILLFISCLFASNENELILNNNTKQLKRWSDSTKNFCIDNNIIRSGIGLIEIIYEEKDDIKFKRIVEGNIIFTNDNFGDFKNILELDLHGNVLFSLPNEFKKMTNLYHINLSFNNLNAIPSTICKLKNLEIIDLHLNFIYDIPEKINNLKFLTYFDISKNLLKAVPEQFFELTNLKHLDLSENEIYYIPDSFVKLKNLETLNLSSNKIIYMSDDIGLLSKLKYLNISENPIYLLPITLSRLKNLEELYISKTFIINLPRKIGNLKSLRILDISDDLLNTLPKSIGFLKNLEFLHLNDNNFFKIPEEIGKLTSLKGLYLNNNNIQDLPNTLINLKDTIVTINCSSNRLNDIGEGTSFGKIEMMEIFKEKFILSSSKPFKEKIIDVKKQLEKKSNIIIWNHIKLNEICPTFFKMNELNIIELFNLWSKSPFMIQFAKEKAKFLNLLNISEIRVILTSIYGNIINYESIDRIIEEIYNLHSLLPEQINDKDDEVFYITEELTKLELNIDENKNQFDSILKNIILDLLKKFEHGKLLESFIFYLYNPNESYERWKLNDLYIQMAKNYLQYLIEYLDVDDLDNLSRILIACPDKLISSLTNLYLKKTGKITNDTSLEDIIKIFIGEEKKRIFDLLFYNFNNKKDYHILMYWRNKLKNYIGFNFDVQFCYHDIKNDKFRGVTFDGFNAFFEKFTPEWIIKRLVEIINNDCSYMKIANKRAKSIEHSSLYTDDNMTEISIVQKEFIVSILYEMELFVRKDD